MLKTDRDIKFSPPNGDWETMKGYKDKVLMKKWFHERIAEAHPNITTGNISLSKAIGFDRSDLEKIVDEPDLGWVVFSLIQCKMASIPNGDKDTPVLSLFAFGQESHIAGAGAFMLSDQYEMFIGTDLDSLKAPEMVLGKNIKPFDLDTDCLVTTKEPKQVYTWKTGLVDNDSVKFADLLLDNTTADFENTGMFFFVRVCRSHMEQLCKLEDCKKIAVLPVAFDCRASRFYSRLGTQVSGFYEQNYVTAFIVPLDEEDKIMYLPGKEDVIHFSYLPWEPDYEEWNVTFLFTGEEVRIQLNQ